MDGRVVHKRDQSYVVVLLAKHLTASEMRDTMFGGDNYFVLKGSFLFTYY